MKAMNELQIKLVSGAGFMADMGWSDFLDVINWAVDNNQASADLLGFGGAESDVKAHYIQWCEKNGLNAITSAKRNGWSL